MIPRRQSLQALTLLTLLFIPNIHSCPLCMGRADRAGDSFNERGIQPQKKSKSFFDDVQIDSEIDTTTVQKKLKTKKAAPVSQTKKLNKTSQP